MYRDNVLVTMFTFLSPSQEITCLLPNFYEDLDLIDTDSMPLPPVSDDEIEIIEEIPAKSHSAPACPDHSGNSFLFVNAK